MTVDGQGGGFDGPPKQIDLRAHFQALKDAQAERRIATETERVALELSQHADVFGFQEDSSREEVAVKLIKSLNSDVKAFSDLGDEDQKIIGKAVFMGLNMTCSEGIEDGLLTDMVSDVDVDGIVPEAFKGVGKLVKGVELTKSDVDLIVSVNKKNMAGGVFDARSINERGEVLSTLPDSETVSPIVRDYLALERGLILGLGVPEEPNVTVLNMVESSGSAKKSPSEKKQGQDSRERKLGPTAENNRITEENNRILAGLIDALNKNTVRTEENTVALDENTKRLIELTNAANALGVRIEGLTTAISGEEIQTIVKQFEDEGIFEKGDIGGEDMERMRAALPVEVDDPSVVGRSPDEMRRNRELADTLRAAKLKERLDSDIKNGTKKLSGESDHEYIIGHAEWDRTIGGLYKLLEKIEDGDRSIDDLSTNSSKFTLLYFIKNGEFDQMVLGLNRNVQVLDGKGKPMFDKDGKPIYRSEKMTSETLDYLKNEIGMRLFLHSFYMAASKCASIEDMVRVVVSMHEGDVYKDLDKLFVSFFLKNREDLKLRGAGLTELPIDKAWDWRQLGYFRIETLLDYAKDDQKGFLNYLDTQMGVNEGGSLAEILEGAREKGVNNNIISLYLKFLGSGEDRPTSEIMAKPPMPLVMNEANPNNDVFKEMIKLGKAVPYKDTQHGIDRDYYKNFWMIEIDGSTQATFLKEYMIWRIMGRKEQFYTEKQARRAFELAKRFSVATFMDATADLNFEKDPYADDINFQLQRAADGPQGEQNRRAKNKNVGHPDTIVKIKGLNCHWMYNLRSKEIKTKKGETMIRAVTPSYSPLYASDLDMGLYNRKSGMVRHFLGIVESQSEFVKSAFLTKFTPKDVMSQGFLNDLFAKINKTVYDMCDAGIMSVNFEDVNQYNGLYYEESKADAQAMIADQFRAAWVYNVFRMAMEEETGWNLTEMDKFIRKLRYSSTMAGEVTEEIRKDKKSIYGSGFIKKELLDNAIRDTGIRRFLARRDSIEEFNAGSSKILGGLFKGGK